MLTPAERFRIDVMAKLYEEGIKYAYKGSTLEGRIPDFVARYRSAMRLRIENAKPSKQ